MGSVMSLHCSKGKTAGQNEGNLGESRKRQKICLPFDEENSRLIPSLPDELSIQILARLPRICHFNAWLVSRKWKSTLMSPEIYSLRKELGKTEEWLYVLTKGEEEKLLWYALDPISKTWQRLPPMPVIVYEEESRKGLLGLWNMVGPSIRISEIVRWWFGRKDASEQMPFCGCAIGAVDRCLYVLGGFSRASTMKCVWKFDPVEHKWSEVSSMLVSRAYSKTGILNNKLYVVGGVTRLRGGLSPLQSAEVYDPSTDTWSEVPSMPFSKAQVLPNAFFADLLKPIATGMTSYNGRLCVPQSLYSWPFFVDVGGEIYDPETNSWAEMPAGMGEGWPARQAGTKLSVVVDGELYAFDPSSSMENGKIKVYDQKDDTWKVVIGEVPVYDLAESESPYLLAGFHGKLHFITRDRNRAITVLRADVPDNLISPPFTSVLSSCSLHEKADSLGKSDTVIWKVIATKDFVKVEEFGKRSSGTIVAHGGDPTQVQTQTMEAVALKFSSYDSFVLKVKIGLSSSLGLQMAPTSDRTNTVNLRLWHLSRRKSLPNGRKSLYSADKENAPKTINDLKLINAGRILENSRMLSESRRLVDDELPETALTMHVVLRPPMLEKKSEKLQDDPPLKNRCSCSIL